MMDSADVAHAWEVINERLTETDGKDLIGLYDDWADTYDKELAEVNYNGPSIAAEYFAEYAGKFGISKDSLILDAIAGTGAVGKLLKGEYGFINIDGVDGSSEMLRKAAELGVYRNLITACMGGDHKLPLNDNSYKSAVVAGALGKHLGHDIFPEIIRVVKPGGLVLNVHRYSYNSPGNYLEDLTETFSKWEKQGLWEFVAEIVPKDKMYYANHEAVVTVYKVCAC